jgi:hypothetical protein
VCISPLFDGGFLHDYSTSENAGNKGEDDICLVKYDSAFQKEWEACYGGTKTEFVVDKIEIPGKGIFILANTYSKDFDVGWHDKARPTWLLRLDYSGNLVKSETFSGWGSRLVVVDEGKSVVILGDTFSSEFCQNNGALYMQLFKVKLEDGNVEWKRCYGGKGGEFAEDIAFSQDGGLLMMGVSNSEISGDVQSKNQALFWTDVWVVKLAPEDVRIEEECALFQIAPHPVASDLLTLEFQNPAVEASDITVFDARGALVYRYPNQVIPVSKKVTVTLPLGMSAGMYFVQVSGCSGKRVFGKFVKVE